MIAMDSQTGKEVANLPTAEGMDGVYFDAKRKLICISGGRAADAGSVFIYQQADLDHYETIAKISTRPGAGTSFSRPSLTDTMSPHPLQTSRPQRFSSSNRSRSSRRISLTIARSEAAKMTLSPFVWISGERRVKLAGVLERMFIYLRSRKIGGPSCNPKTGDNNSLQ